MKNDVTYAIYHPLDGKLSREIIDVLGRQGFTEVKSGGRAQGIYEVSMKDAGGDNRKHGYCAEGSFLKGSACAQGA